MNYLNEFDKTAENLGIISGNAYSHDTGWDWVGPAVDKLKCQTCKDLETNRYGLRSNLEGILSGEVNNCPQCGFILNIEE